MKVIYPLAILRHENVLAAIVVIADGLDALVVRYTGEDDHATVNEAERVAARLIGILVGVYEIEVPTSTQSEWMAAAGDVERWVTT